MIRIILEAGLHNERSIPARRGGLRLRGPARQLHPRSGRTGRVHLGLVADRARAGSAAGRAPAGAHHAPGGPDRAGGRFLQRVAPGLQQIDAAFADLDFLRDRPAGTLRINLAAVAAEQLVCPHLSDFLARYPEVTVELYADRTLADIVEGQFDAGIRLGECLQRDMVALPLGPMQRQAVVATPGYFARRGVPATPDALTGHDCIRWRRSDGRIQPWEFTRGGRDFQVEVDGRLVVNDTVMGLDALRRGTGLGQVFAWQVRGDIAAGRLQSVLEDWQAPFPGWFVYYPAREHMAPKLRVFIDFMRERLDAGGR